ncbi:Serine phosphatase RsbU, regulator of sigma subunit [Desulfatibacillum alkenivorans DSM 16219]|uniref:Serine phosphatase RsbU, regulator of sigma subunit n=1 Tax=Desulfatibacillum alkenivorans DSM 16219 TaxID=1121393 RepID=A0A1M6T8L4_9BACT|nr:SpoIIE family protein phosphatase [Desulfatibacillum alkenivorans]SHK53226.1 Serine phosphatase RsbU, regulator of sigma subunit [Desulfatibacillum alkenivorans DSM 16219]
MSLRIKLTLLNLLLILVVGVTLTGYMASMQQRDLLHEKIIRAQSLLDNLIIQNKEVLILKDDFALEISARRFIKNQDILFLLVEYGNHQLFVTEEDDKQSLQAIAESGQSESAFHNEPVRLLQKEMIVGDKVMGNYVLGLSLASLREKTAKTMERAALIASLLTLSFMLIALLVTRRMLRPIWDIGEFARDLGSGALGRQIEINRKDEIGRLADVMNWMSKELLTAQNDLVQKELLEQEFEIAQNIQQQFLPKEKIQVPNLLYETYFKPARQVGGDAFDFFQLADGKVGFMVADVAGKGVEGALGMIITITMLHTVISRGVNDPLKIMSEVNDELLTNLPGTMFVTMAFAVFDPEQGTLTLASAGHPEMYHMGAHETVNLFEENAGVPLGMVESELWETEIQRKVIRMKEGESLLIYTDGVTETFNENGDLFGDENLTSFLEENRLLNPSEFVQALVDRLDSFRGRGDILDDDITVLVLKHSA